MALNKLQLLAVIEGHVSTQTELKRKLVNMQALESQERLARIAEKAAHSKAIQELGDQLVAATDFAAVQANLCKIPICFQTVGVGTLAMQVRMLANMLLRPPPDNMTFMQDSTLLWKILAMPRSAVWVRGCMAAHLVACDVTRARRLDWSGQKPYFISASLCTKEPCMKLVCSCVHVRMHMRLHVRVRVGDGVRPSSHSSQKAKAWVLRWRCPRISPWMRR